MRKMKKKVLVVLFLFVSCISVVLADEVDCEAIETRNWGWRHWKTCSMDQTTQIISAEATIATRDGSIEGLWFFNNKKIKVLPVKISQKFPNLGGLDAGQCSLTTISKENFKGLSNLRYLSLYGNHIERITNNVFDDLVSLEKLWLYRNKLKFINGKIFARLTKLTHVFMNSNQCINENFEGLSRIAVLQKTVDRKCSFDELEDDSIEIITMAPSTTAKTVSYLVDQKCENKNQDLALEGINTKTSEVISILNEIKTQQKKECGCIANALEVQAKTLKEQTKDIIALNKKLAQADSEATLKMREIGRLNDRLEKNSEEIIAKDEKIKKLEGRIKFLTENVGTYK